MLGIKPVAADEVKYLDCDKLAAIPGDPNLNIAGVSLNEMEHDKAIVACQDALQSHPEQPRFAFQLARAMIAAKRPSEAQKLAELAIDDGYEIAQVVLGYLAAAGLDQKKDEAEASARYRKAAEAGLPMAAYVLAVRYSRGVGVNKDIEKAYQWLERAAEGNYPLAIYDLGRLYLRGDGRDKDPSKAKNLFERAAKLGVAAAHNDLGHMYQNSLGVPKDLNLAAKYYREGISKGYALSYYNYGLLLSGYGKGAETFQQAEKHLRYALEHGVKQADISLALLLDTEPSLEGSISEIASLYERAANRGDPDGLLEYGLLLLKGKGVNADPKKGMELLLKSAESNNPDALFNIAYVYDQGIGFPQNKTTAFKWYERAREKGNPRALQRIAEMLIKGEGTPKDVKKGIQIFEKLGDAGDRYSQWYLGDLFRLGKYVPANYSASVKWYRLAAEQGDLPSLSRLGHMYVYGKGIKKDVEIGIKMMLRAAEPGDKFNQNALGMALSDLRRYDEAIRWFNAAVEQGSTYAQTTLGNLLIQLNRSPEEVQEGIKTITVAADSGSDFAQWSLGLVYEQGLVVSRDYGLAAKWMRLAAEQGNDFAQNKLGYYYWNGQGVSQDLETSVSWYEKSANQDNMQSVFMLGVAYQYGMGVEKSLAKSQELYQSAAGKNEPMSIAALAAMNTTGEVPDADFRVGVALMKKAIELSDKAGPKYGAQTAYILERAGIFSNHRGRYAEGDKYYKRALKLRKEISGENNVEYVDALSGYASLLQQSGRYSQSDALFKRSLKILKGLDGSHDQKIAEIQYDYALLKEAIGDYGEAERLFRKIRDVLQFAPGTDAVRMYGLITGNIARIFTIRGKLGEAESLFQEALERVSGDELSNESQILRLRGDYAQLLTRLERYKEAEEIFRDVWHRVKHIGIHDHPLVFAAAMDFAKCLQENDKSGEALKHISELSKAYTQRLARQSRESLTELSAERNIIRSSLSHLISLLLDPKIQVGAEEHQKRLHLSFEMLQLIRSASAASAINQMGARFALGDNDLAQIIRERQDLLNNWRGMDATFVSSLGGSGGSKVQASPKIVRAELTRLETEIDKTDRRLLAEYPQYYQLSSTQPVSIVETQSLIEEDEALLVYLLGARESYIWVIRNNSLDIKRVEFTFEEVDETVAELRGALDPSGITKLSEVPSFDRTKAYELYKKLFAPAEPLLEGVRQVMVVPDGALQSLPLGVLVTEEPQGEFTDFSGYRQVPWLAKKYALSVLPSVNSLKALRVFARVRTAKEPFTGFGDPVLDGDAGSRGGVELASLFSRGSVADVEQLKSLGRLPDTADELRAMAKSLNAGEGSIYLGSQATESRVKETDLSDVRVLAFATHGLVAGQLKGVSEPGLVLTPPEQANEQDDGFLTASEVAQLKLNADWVILSACDTASSDGTPGAEGLSGLAKAFFYAGSRALLVSHWPVLSDAAKTLTTRMLKGARDKTIGRAEALKRSMISLINTPDVPHYAHPMFWAPFVVVGEGGVAAVN